MEQGGATFLQWVLLDLGCTCPRGKAVSVLWSLLRTFCSRVRGIPRKVKLYLGSGRRSLHGSYPIIQGKQDKDTRQRRPSNLVKTNRPLSEARCANAPEGLRSSGKPALGSFLLLPLCPPGPWLQSCL